MKSKKEIRFERRARAKVTGEEELRRMRSLQKRKEKIIAAVREGTH